MTIIIIMTAIWGEERGEENKGKTNNNIARNTNNKFQHRHAAWHATFYTECLHLTRQTGNHLHTKLTLYTYWQKAKKLIADDLHFNNKVATHDYDNDNNYDNNMRKRKGNRR